MEFVVQTLQNGRKATTVQDGGFECKQGSYNE